MSAPTCGLGSAVKRVTHKDVAERAGVSVATVSYVLNNGPRPVSVETRTRAEEAVAELGYYPNELARSLRLQQSFTIGVILPNILSQDSSMTYGLHNPQ